MAVLQLWIEGIEPALSVRRASVREQLSGLFTLAIVARSPRADLDLDAAIFQPASFTLVGGSGDQRFYTGLCEAIEQIGAEPTGLSTYAVRLVPRLHLLTLRSNHRIFQRASIPEILSRLFATRVRLSRAGRTGAVTLRDLDFRHPAFALAERAAALGPLPTLLEHHRYEPGAFRVLTDAPSTTPIADALGVARHDPSVGRRLAEQRLRGEQAGAFHVAFETNALDLAPGAIVSIADHPHPLLDARRRLLVTHVALDAQHGEPWRAQVQAVFAEPPYQPLPAHATKTVWRSQSTPGAEGFNEISFEDQRGHERLYERAERDKESLIRNDERTTVGHARARRVALEL